MKIKTTLVSTFAAIGLFAASANAVSIGMTTSLTPNDTYITSGETFDLVVAIDPASTELNLTSLEFMFSSFDGAFALLGYTFLATLDGSLSNPPILLGLGPVPIPPGSSIDIVSLNLAAIGSAGIHSISIEGLTSNATGAFFYDNNFDFFEADIRASVDLEIHEPASVPDPISTGGILAGSIGLMLVSRLARSKKT